MQRVIAIVLGSFCGFAAFAIGWGLTGSRSAATVVALAAAITVAIACVRKPFLLLNDRDASTTLKWIGAVGALAALVQIGRLTIFMIDPTAVAFSSFPSSRFEVGHSCLSSYYCAVEAVDTHPNVYDENLYALPGDPKAPRQPKLLESFRVDQYEYPPPFLLLPRMLHAAAPSFLEHRALWFGLNLIVILAAMLLTTQALGGAARTRAVLLMPLAFAAMTTLSMLQKGNVHGMVVALAMLGILCFARGKHALGGLLLAFTIVSKLYPGLLVLYFLVRKQWKAVWWTAAMGSLLVAISITDVGIEPYRAFIEHFPRLLGGEAFPAFRNPNAMAINLSIPGLVFKLKLFDVPGMGFPLAKIVGWIYTAIAIGLTVIMARRARGERENVLACLAILALATLRSPFLPQAYGTFPALWLLVLVAAGMQPNAGRVIATVVAFAALSLYLPIDTLPPRVLAVVMLLPQAVLIGLPIYVLTGLHAMQVPLRNTTPRPDTSEQFG